MSRPSEAPGFVKIDTDVSVLVDQQREVIAEARWDEPHGGSRTARSLQVARGVEPDVMFAYSNVWLQFSFFPEVVSAETLCLMWICAIISYLYFGNDLDHTLDTGHLLKKNL